MNSDFTIENIREIHQKAKQAFLQEDYSQAACLYEALIQIAPNEKSYYWPLGLMFLLQGQELEAQATWFIGLSDGNLEQSNCGAKNLLDMLTSEVEKREKNSDHQTALLIRQHIYEIAPSDLDNVLRVIQLFIKIDELPEVDFYIYRAIDIIKSKESSTIINHVNISQTIQSLLKSSSVFESTIDLIEESINAVSGLDITEILFDEINRIRLNNAAEKELVIRLLEICLYLVPNNLSVLKSLIAFQQDNFQYFESITNAENLFKASVDLVEKIAAKYLTLRAFMLSGGEWSKAKAAYNSLQCLIQELIHEKSELSLDQVAYLIVVMGASAYFEDVPKRHHQIRNSILSSYQNKSVDILLPRLSLSKENSPIKVGYISSCFRRHSISWLCRWLFKYHDPEKFSIYAYSLKNSNDDMQEFIACQVSKFYDLSFLDEPDEIASRIYKDEIDILIDLDSTTSLKVSSVMLLKPAPVQVTWLGSDASGVSTIDYFIADDYVLPKSAQNYYLSKIWRLPNTYIAIDGFEIGVPTLRRDQLKIPDKAVIFFSSQTGYKRHPDTIRLQMQILKEVPGSYFLIRGLADENSVRHSFEEISREEGIDFNRLRFLPIVASEEIHRANLAIADIVLDTYPYNGATTTLETLWMGIPLVTRVGTQFAARNSYTFMKNAGIDEGIAWSDEEYIDWGVRLGKNAELRQQISLKLKQSRNTAPLWNAKQFTREMEDAYCSMWALHLAKQ